MFGEVEGVAPSPPLHLGGFAKASVAQRSTGARRLPLGLRLQHEKPKATGVGRLSNTHDRAKAGIFSKEDMPAFLFVGWWSCLSPVACWRRVPAPRRRGAAATPCRVVELPAPRSALALKGGQPQASAGRFIGRAFLKILLQRFNILLEDLAAGRRNRAASSKSEQVGLPKRAASTVKVSSFLEK